MKPKLYTLIYKIFKYILIKLMTYIQHFWVFEVTCLVLLIYTNKVTLNQKNLTYWEEKKGKTVRLTRPASNDSGYSQLPRWAPVLVELHALWTEIARSPTTALTLEDSHTQEDAQASWYSHPPVVSSNNESGYDKEFDWPLSWEGNSKSLEFTVNEPAEIKQES